MKSHGDRTWDIETFASLKEEISDTDTKTCAYIPIARSLIIYALDTGSGTA